MRQANLVRNKNTGEIHIVFSDYAEAEKYLADHGGEDLAIEIWGVWASYGELQLAEKLVAQRGEL